MKRTVGRISTAGYEQAAPSTSADSNRLADILESRQVPRCMTDAVAFEGNWKWNDQFTGGLGSRLNGDYVRAKARAAGVNPTGKKYLSGLARFPGDPEAWVDSRGDVERILKKRNWSSTGMVNVPEVEVEVEEKPYRVADDLVESHFQAELASRPDAHALSPQKKLDLKEEVRERITPDDL